MSRLTAQSPSIDDVFKGSVGLNIAPDDWENWCSPVHIMEEGDYPLCLEDSVANNDLPQTRILNETSLPLPTSPIHRIELRFFPDWRSQMLYLSTVTSMGRACGINVTCSQNGDPIQDELPTIDFADISDDISVKTKIGCMFTFYNFENFTTLRRKLEMYDHTQSSFVAVERQPFENVLQYLNEVDAARERLEIEDALLEGGLCLN